MAKHRLIPGHDGGTYHPWNVVEIPDHVHHDLHFARWIETGDIRDYKSSKIALNATTNGKRGGNSSHIDPMATILKTAATRKANGDYQEARRKAHLKIDQPTASKLGWSRLTVEERAAREAKRLETRQRNKLKQESI